jgi:GT2 family glycosyltransferase
MTREDRSVGCALVEPTDATIIVVNYQGRGVLGACLDGVAGQVGASYDVVVVDNASPDGSADEAEGREGVRVVRNSVNVGFGAACNQAAGLARGRHLAFLNHDSVPEPRWLASLVEVADGDPDTGAVQGVVLMPDGSVNTAGNRQHFLGFSWAPAAPHAPDGPPYEITCGSGASLLVPRARFEEVGGFWDELFLYAEDTDLSWRLRLAGLRILACPAARSEHAYEFGRNPEKYFHLERNRLLVLSANYETATLVRLAPLLLATEAALLVIAARGGWLPQKLRAARAVAAAVPALRAQRRRVQRARRVGDASIVSRFESRLGPEFGTAVAALSAPPLRAYARVAGLSARS